MVASGGTTALFFLRDKASVSPGTSVLVNGASGAVGTNAVQLAKHFVATVTGVANAANASLVTTLGADRVIDYARNDLAATAERFDAVLDTVGNLSIASGRRLLCDGGVPLLVAASLGDMLRAPAASSRVRLPIQLLAEGRIRVVHDRIYDLAGIVEARRRVDSAHKVGNVIVRPRLS